MIQPYRGRCTEAHSIVAQNYLDAYQRTLKKMICGMTKARLTDSISQNFIAQMIPHHRAAIRMSENILKYTTNVQLQDVAIQIVREQTKSIADMERILGCCERLRNTREELCCYQREMERIMQRMFGQMRAADATNCINRDFLCEMIPHHRGAVEMSQLTLKNTICQGLTPILNAIITSQEKGIWQMEQLLQAISC